MGPGSEAGTTRGSFLTAGKELASPRFIVVELLLRVVE
jgi:hypothetical protein